MTNWENKSILRPTKCCDVNSCDHCIPMPINGKIVYIDFCIADIVAALNAANIKTVESCCGHDRQLYPEKAGVIELLDGRLIKIISGVY